MTKLEQIIKKGFEKGGPFSYVEAFLKDRTVAAIVPSSKYLIRRILKAMDLPHNPHIVEYGAAEGVVTKEILKAMPSHGRLIAIEKSPGLYDTLSVLKEPRLKTIRGDVKEIDHIFRKEGIKHVDCITSGIPFSFFKPEEREELLRKTVQHLKPSGRFVAYQCTTHLIPLLKRYFRKMHVEFEIRNLPPHFVFTGIK
ncbi:MAG: methyltransferase domain-containing protein [Elusimicrobia bacterium]|nr:methyltransferase domain-containing protein [Elusimicrobiota bacterium]